MCVRAPTCKSIAALTMSAQHLAHFCADQVSCVRSVPTSKGKPALLFRLGVAQVQQRLQHTRRACCLDELKSLALALNELLPLPSRFSPNVKVACTVLRMSPFRSAVSVQLAQARDANVLVHVVSLEKREHVACRPSRRR